MGFAQSVYDPLWRKRDKEASRARDEGRLLSGAISRQDMNRENGFLSSLKIVRVDIVGRRVRLKA
jgi:hypothetical protein